MAQPPGIPGRWARSGLRKHVQSQQIDHLASRGAKQMTTDYWQLVDPVWDSLVEWDTIPGFQFAFAAADPPARTLFAAHWLYSEVCNGGFKQFYWNTTGILAPEAANAFESIGMPRTVEIIRRSMSWFPPPYPRERQTRIELLDAYDFSRPARDGPFDSLDVEFYDVVESENGGFVRAANEFAGRYL